MSQENVEIVRRAYESLARRDWDGLWANAHPDFELHTQLAGSYRGPDEAQRFAEDRFAAFESFTAEPVEFFESDDQVVVFVTQRAQPKGTSAAIEIKTGDVWTLRDGKVLTLETFPQTDAELIEVLTAMADEPLRLGEVDGRPAGAAAFVNFVGVAIEKRLATT